MLLEVAGELKSVCGTATGWAEAAGREPSFT
jgi:hypothetical protein